MKRKNVDEPYLPETVSRRFPPTRIEYKDASHHFFIRPFEPSEASALNEVIKESANELYHFLFLPYFPSEMSDRVDRLLKAKANYFMGLRYEMGVFEASTGEILMGCGYFTENGRNPAAMEIGFWTATKYARQGWATLVTQVLIAVGFEAFFSDRLEVVVNPENAASLRVIHKCGFKHEGKMRNSLLVPTDEMVKHGFTRERTLSLFALIPDDISELDWYPYICSNTTLTTLAGVEKKLKNTT